jgi:hypothetical protein
VLLCPGVICSPVEGVTGGVKEGLATVGSRRLTTGLRLRPPDGGLRPNWPKDRDGLEAKVWPRRERRLEAVWEGQFGVLERYVQSLGREDRT